MGIGISLLVLIVLLIVFFLLIHFVGKQLVEIALNRNNDWYQNLGHVKMNPDAFAAHQDLSQEERLQQQLGDAFWKDGQLVSIQSHDKLKLSGTVFRGDPNRWVIAVHGYRTSGKQDMAYAAWRYAQKGYSVLVPDLRGHGASEGEYIGMGWLDRLDLQEWIHWIILKAPYSKIILHGASMGASAVLMTSGEKLPPNVELLIADSGFSSFYFEVKHILENSVKLPKRFLLSSANRQARKIAGFSLIEASATKQLGSNHLPLLVIHGDEDKFVPVDSAEQILRATAGQSEFLEVHNAGHLMSMVVEPGLYWSTIFSFIEKHQSELF